MTTALLRLTTAAVMLFGLGLSTVAAQPDFAEVAHCERVLRDRFPVVYEDQALVVFRAAGG